MFDSKREMERMNEAKIQEMMHLHEAELVKRKEDYQNKMHADEIRF